MTTLITNHGTLNIRGVDRVSPVVIGMQEGKKKTLLSEFAFMVLLALWYTLVNSLEKTNHTIG